MTEMVDDDVVREVDDDVVARGLNDSFAGRDLWQKTSFKTRFPSPKLRLKT